MNVLSASIPAGLRTEGRRVKHVEPAAVECLSAVLCVVMAVVFVAGRDRMPLAGWLASWFIGLLILTTMLQRAGRRRPMLLPVRLLVSGAVLVSVYESLGRAIAAFGPPLRDGWVLKIERLVTGGRLPPLTAVSLPSSVVDGLSLAYVLYFVLPVALVATLIRRRQVREAYGAVFILLVTFYVHYAIYVLVPVVGPYRTLELPASVRVQMVAGGGDIAHVVRTSVAALEGTPQDAFPSAHASIAILVAAFARKYRLPSRWWFYVLTMAIVMSTVLLGYHYVVDVVAALPVVWLGWGVGRLREAARRPTSLNDSVSRQSA